MDVEYVKIKSIRLLEEPEDVYCLGSKKNGTMIANGIITKNCDALRYALKSYMKKRTVIKPDQDLENPNFGRNLGWKR